MKESQPSHYAVSFSHGIRTLKHIAQFLDVSAVVSPAVAVQRRLCVSCVVVWGRKKNTQRALDYAQQRQLPVRYVEDGWIRSCSKNAHSRISYSLLVDNTGVYYDSEQPNDLENFLNLPDSAFANQCTAESLTYAKHCRELIVQQCITKYNYCRTPDSAVLECDARELVLVIDQTRDDASVRFGALQASGFTDMLDRALADNPQARVVVRTHPDVVVGKRRGYLTEYAKKRGVEISADGDNPVHWLKRAVKVYVGTSQLGYEALMCGCSVDVAGLPFYAGWGLTTDRQQIARRKRSRTLDQLFYATHVYLARYCNPVTGETWQLDQCIDHVRLQQRSFKRNARRFACVGITPWKRRYLAQYLRSPDGDVRFCKPGDIRTDEQPLFWSFKDDGRRNTLSEQRADSDVKSTRAAHLTPSVSRIEDGFIRSRGLGSDFVAPASLVVDHNGLYFDPATPSDLETLLNEFDCSDSQLDRAVRLRQLLLDTRLTKYNVGAHLSGTRPAVSDSTQRVVLVVGQVEDDQSVRRGCADIATNTELCAAVRKARPNAFIVYKPHPDVESGNRRGAVSSAALHSCIDHVEKERHFLDCLDNSDELHTMTSLSGFEAMLREKPVWTYGTPFYAGWGLTHDHVPCSRRRRTRTLDELVYLCLVEYPTYLDLSSGEFIAVEQLIHSLSMTHDLPLSVTSGWSRWMNKLSNVANALQYNP